VNPDHEGNGFTERSEAAETKTEKKRSMFMVAYLIARFRD